MTTPRLGVGLDMPWGHEIGWSVNDDGPSDRVHCFLNRYGGAFDYFVFSFQPRGSSAYDASAYLPAYERLIACLPSEMPIALHQTTFNMGALDPYPRHAAAAFTNDLHAALGFAWTVEDLGIWSVGGVPMPYPLPPVLDESSLTTVTASIRDLQAQLDLPLHVEFPGFHDKYAVVYGEMHAYDFFRLAVVESGVDATLDVAHLLTYQWMLGARASADLYADLERLPLDSVTELHLSGCSVVHDRILDLHHGILLEQQLELTARLLQICPRLSYVTYEDPRFDAAGTIIRKSEPGLQALRELVAGAA